MPFAQVRLKPSLDENLPPIVDGTVADFILKYYELATADLTEPSKYGPHTHFALTGEFLDDQREMKRMRIRHPENNINPFSIKQESDIDSTITLVYAGNAFPLQPGHSVHIHFLNNTAMTLTLPLHIPRYVYYGPSGLPTGENAEHHMIPNCQLGYIGGGNIPKILMRIFFPHKANIRNTKDGSHINADDMERFIDKILIPAVHEVLPEEHWHEWGINYKNEQWRAGRQNGSVVFTTRTLPQQYMDDLLAAMHRLSRDTPARDYKFHDFFLQLQVQGCKKATVHPPLDDNNLDALSQSRSTALAAAVDPLSSPPFDLLDNWYADVATVVHTRNENKSLFVHADKLDWLIGHQLQAPVPEVAACLASKRSGNGVYIDEIAHMKKAAGVRIDIKDAVRERLGGALGTEYYQVYPTDRGLLSLKDAGLVAKHIRPDQVISDFDKAKERHFKPLMKVFKDALETKFKVSVRTESRVPFSAVFESHWKIADEILRSCLFELSTEDYWTFRIIRLQAIIAALEAIIPKLPKVPTGCLSAPVSLIVGLTWMANALINRPDEGFDFDILADTLSVHREVGNKICAINDLNYFTLHSLKTDPFLRVSSHRTVSDKVLASLCGIYGAGWQAKYHELMKCKKNLVQTKLPAEWGQTSPRTLEPTASGSKRKASGLGSGGHHMQRKKMNYDIRNKASVVAVGGVPALSEDPVQQGYASEEDDPEQRHATHLTDRDQINEILILMPIEVIRNITTSKTHGYMGQMNSAEVCQVEFSIFEQPQRLPEILRVWRQVMTTKLWDGVVAKLFPTYEEAQAIVLTEAGTKRPLQGLATNNVTWYPTWVRLVGRLNEENKEREKEVVDYARSILHNRARWLPLGTSDRLWSNKRAGQGPLFGDQTLQGEGLAVVFNPRLTPVLDPLVPGGVANVPE